jgi:dipeptide/tripeptide permease
MNNNAWSVCGVAAVAELNERLTTLGIAVNLVTYLTGTMHLGNAESANVVTNFMGTSFMLCLLGGFVADSFLGRYLTIAIFTAVQASVSQYSFFCHTYPPTNVGLFLLDRFFFALLDNLLFNNSFILSCLVYPPPSIIHPFKSINVTGVLCSLDVGQSVLLDGSAGQSPLSFHHRQKKISAWAFLFMLLSLFPSLVGAGLVVSKNQIKIGTFRPQDAPSLKRTRAANETNKQTKGGGYVINFNLAIIAVVISLPFHVEHKYTC